MQKKYNCIPIEDYYVVVDKNAPIEAMKTPVWNEVAGPLVKYKELKDFYCTYSISKENPLVNKIDIFCGIHTIVATIGKRIDSLPLIEILDNAAQLVAFENAHIECCRAIIYDNNIFGSGIDFTREQKAEVKIELLKELNMWPIQIGITSKVYTEEDMRKAILMAKETEEEGGDLMAKYSMQCILKSLKSKPITAVELEVYIDDPGCNCKAIGYKDKEGCSSRNQCKTYLKIDKNNIIHPINVFYE